MNITNLVAWCGVGFADETANPLYYARNLRLNGVNVGSILAGLGIMATLIGLALQDT